MVPGLLQNLRIRQQILHAGLGFREQFGAVRNIIVGRKGHFRPPELILEGNVLFFVRLVEVIDKGLRLAGDGSSRHGFDSGYE